MAQQLGTEDIELLQALLTQLVAIVGPTAAEPAGSSLLPSTAPGPTR
jgi:hypothetical protein